MENEKETQINTDKHDIAETNYSLYQNIKEGTVTDETQVNLKYGIIRNSKDINLKYDHAEHKA